MKPREAGLLLAFVPAFVCGRPASAATHVTGVVRTTLRPVAGVHVVSPKTGRYAQTDTAGRFDLGPIPPGSYDLRLFALGYETTLGRIIAGNEEVLDTGDWLLIPLRPDGSGVGRAPPAPGSVFDMRRADSLLADSLLRLPPPLPMAPVFELYLSPDERARFVAPEESTAARVSHGAWAVQEILAAIVTADSITRSTEGTGAPGYQTWRQWSERLALLEGDSTLADAGPLLRRARAYTRTRAAFAAGATYAGWLAAREARTSLDQARRDSVSAANPADAASPASVANVAAAESAAFLEGLSEELDRQFIPGAPAPQPPPAPPKKKSKKRKSSGR